MYIYPNPHIWIYNNKSRTVWQCIYHFVFRLAMCKSKTNKTLKQQKLNALYSLYKVEIQLSLTSIGQSKRSFSVSTRSQLFWSGQYYACRVGRATSDPSSLTNDAPMLFKKQWISEGVEHRMSSTTDMFPGRGISHLGTDRGTLDQPICALLIFSCGGNWNCVYSHKPYTLYELKEVIRDKKWQQSLVRWCSVRWPFFINSTVVSVSKYTTEVENKILLTNTRDYISWDLIDILRGHISRDI